MSIFLRKFFHLNVLLIYILTASVFSQVHAAEPDLRGCRILPLELGLQSCLQEQEFVGNGSNFVIVSPCSFNTNYVECGGFVNYEGSDPKYCYQAQSAILPNPDLSEMCFIDRSNCGSNETIDPETGACQSTDDAKKLGNANQCMLTDNPINPSTGNKFLSQNDISSPSLSFTRYYNSHGKFSFALGKGWSANYLQRLYVKHFGSLGNVMLYEENGRGLAFYCPQNAGICTPEPDVTQTLEKLTDGFTLVTENNTVEQYNTAGQLLSITSLSGQTTILSYSSITNLLETVTDHFGKTLIFTYDADNRVETVTDPDGEVYTYGYNVDDSLTTVTYPDDTPGIATDNPIRQYQYNNPNFLNHITGIIDENGNQFATYDYDTNGLAILSQLATVNGNDVERVDITYNANGTTTIADALGASNTYTYNTIFGVPRTESVTGGQCASGCGDEGQAQTYDANGFLASRTDFEGNTTNFTNNARGLQESRTEAVGTPEARTITTEWHPTFRLPTKIIEPGKETIFTYDTQGRLLSRTEREI